MADEIKPAEPAPVVVVVPPAESVLPAAEEKPKLDALLERVGGLCDRVDYLVELALDTELVADEIVAEVAPVPEAPPAEEVKQSHEEKPPVSADTATRRERHHRLI